MTDETKNFVRNSLSSKKVGELIYVPPEKTRRKQREAAIRENESIKLENINITEFSVKSKYDDYEIAVSCYVPTQMNENNSIIMFVHGGGWTLGRGTTKHSVCLLAESTRSCWLSVEYRLAPEYRFPTQINDCISVFEWIHANKLKFGNKFFSVVCLYYKSI